MTLPWNLSFVLLTSILALGPLPANSQGNPIGNADLTGAVAQAQLLAAQAKVEERGNRDAVLAAWINAGSPGEERVVVRCSGRSCSVKEKERIMDRLVAFFARMPEFLQNSGLKQVRWNQVSPGDRADGMGLDGVLTLQLPPDAPIDIILVHELAHLYFEVHARDVAPFLDIRFRNEPMRGRVAELRRYLEESGQTGCGPEKPACLDERARDLIRAARIPQRFPDDLHAIGSDTGYWASSIELAFRAWRGEGDSYLTDFFDKAEISWLLTKLGVAPRVR